MFRETITVFREKSFCKLQEMKIAGLSWNPQEWMHSQSFQSVPSKSVTQGLNSNNLKVRVSARIFIFLVSQAQTPIP